MLLKNRIALRDVLKSYHIKASSDSSIRNVMAIDLSIISNKANIKCIYANGLQSYQFFIRHHHKAYRGSFIKLPSISPANARYTFGQLVVNLGSDRQLRSGLLNDKLMNKYDSPL
jgi:G:T/U-mismatch repair DNA glycosylase